MLIVTRNIPQLQNRVRYSYIVDACVMCFISCHVLSAWTFAAEHSMVAKVFFPKQCANAMGFQHPSYIGGLGLLKLHGSRLWRLLSSIRHPFGPISREARPRSCFAACRITLGCLSLSRSALSVNTAQTQSVEHQRPAVSHAACSTQCAEHCRLP